MLPANGMDWHVGLTSSGSPPAVTPSVARPLFRRQVQTIVFGR